MYERSNFWATLLASDGVTIFNFSCSKYLQTECLCLPFPQFICWNPTPNVMVFGGEACGKELGHEGRALMNGINSLTKEAPESEDPFYHVRTQSEDRNWTLTRQRTLSDVALILNFQASRIMRNKCCF